MTKEEFKVKWESDDLGGGITFGDIANCAVDWGICSRPCVSDMDNVVDAVLEAAGCVVDDQDVDE